MAGSIRRRGRDSWQLRVYRGVDGHGGPRWVTTTVHGSRRHAEAKLAELVAEVGHARLRSGSVGELLERWFAAASPNWAATTTAQTRSIIDCHLAPDLGHIRVDKLTTADIDDLYSHLLRSGGHHGRPLGAGTVHRIHVVLHRALAQAVRWEWIWVNPASSASPPRVPPAEVHPPDPAQVADLLAFVQERSPALFVFLRLAVSTGARRSQLLALRWGDVDFHHGALSFTRAAVTGADGVELRPTKTHRTYRVEIDLTRWRSSPATAPRWSILTAVRPARASCSARYPMGRSPGCPTGSPSRSSPPAAGPALSTSVCTIFVTSWLPRCWPPEFPSPRCRSGSAMLGRRRRSTSMPTPYRAVTAARPRPWRASSRRRLTHRAETTHVSIQNAMLSFDVQAVVHLN
jgi:hypothetical protein